MKPELFQAEIIITDMYDWTQLVYLQFVNGDKTVQSFMDIPLLKAQKKLLYGRVMRECMLCTQNDLMNASRHLCITMTGQR